MHISQESFIELSTEEALELASKILDSVRVVSRARARGAYDTIHLTGNDGAEIKITRIRIGERVW